MDKDFHFLNNELILLDFGIQSPLNSDEDSGLRKGKSAVTDVLAAKLRSKFPGEFTVKRTLATDTKINTANRNRIFERNKGFQKVYSFLEIKMNRNFYLFLCFPNSCSH